LANTTRVLARSGLLGPYRPDHLVAMVSALRRYGLSPAAGYAVHSVADRDGIAVVDERGRLTFGEMEQRTAGLAAALAGRGIGGGSRVGVLCRNGRGFIEVTVALAKVGADALYLNTGFAGPQLRDVLEREGATALLLDEDFLTAASAVPAGLPRLLVWTAADRAAAAAPGPDVDTLIAAGGGLPGVPLPGRPSRQIILTSGTTGSPKGAHRSPPSGLEPLVALLSMIPLRRRDSTLIAAPMFHAWGLAHLALGLLFGSTLVLRRQFDPVETLRLVEEEQVTVLALVPVMLQRIMDLPEATRGGFDTSSLRVIALSGSALPGSLAVRAMDAFGDIVYNLYGSTEVAWVTVATPADLRRAPGTAGRPPPGTVVRLLDDDGRPVVPGRPGRIFARNSLLFDGYTDGGGKEVVDGLMSTGDVGHVDAGGLLFVDGRDDDMIVSGGENVFPREVEDLLAEHPAIEEVSVVGRPDDEFGQRLEAFVVRRPGSTVTGEELKAYVGSHLARYKVPRGVEFVDRLPRTTTGKVLTRDLGREPPGPAGSGDSRP
jgi:fatty-acyl-CoA synthase